MPFCFGVAPEPVRAPAAPLLPPFGLEEGCSGDRASEATGAGSSFFSSDVESDNDCGRIKHNTEQRESEDQGCAKS
jgi:hypothetical protein